ncbi:carbon-nitrogen hydrolase [Auricularia subglabra TFB-10046 SS5]|nr:carbon-nitrogen hydrolase [Auricularia subglabra TFB-10046 SS5]
MAPGKVVRASVIQAGTALYSLSDTLDRLERLAGEAAAQGAALAVFPEAFIGGYPKFSTFGISLGSRAPEGRDEFARYHSSAIEVPNSDAIRRVEEVSKANNLFIVVGVIERDLGTLYCTAVFVDPKQGYVSKHRKLVPTALERVIWGQGDGTTLPVLDTKLGDGEVDAKVSATICWENYMPLLRTHYYTLGTQIYCAPTVDSRPTWQNTMAHIAFEGRCFVLSACQFTQQKDYPADHAIAQGETRNPEGVMIAGGSMIVDPLGNVLAGPLWNAEGVLTADLDLETTIRGKFDLDVVGHYARNDIFNLSVNTKGHPENQ